MLKFRAALQDVFQLGEELFQEDADEHPKALSYELAGFDALVQAVEFASAIDSDLVVSNINGVGNPILKAYLLVYAAKSLDERPAKV